MIVGKYKQATIDERPAPKRTNEAKKKESAKVIPKIPESDKSHQSEAGQSGKKGICITNRVGRSNTKATRQQKKFSDNGDILSPLFRNKITAIDQNSAAPTG